MALERTICFVAHCDDCVDEYSDEGTWHFPKPDGEPPSRDEIVGWLGSDWTIDGSSLVCPTCTANRKCAADGHVWSEWEDRGQFKGRDEGVWRSCERDGGCEKWERHVGMQPRDPAGPVSCYTCSTESGGLVPWPCPSAQEAGRRA